MIEKKAYNFRTRSWRYYRNWLISMLVVFACFSSIFWVSRSRLNLFWAIPLGFLGILIWQIFRLIHPPIRMLPGQLTPSDLELEYENAVITTPDGLQLVGWYLPGDNHAAILIIHGAGSQGLGMIYHALFLVKSGYSVLMIDMRAHGESQGDTCSGGWAEAQDVIGAVDYLLKRNDIDDRKIGVLGLSMGAQAAVWARERCPAIQAFVLEGLLPATPSDLAPHDNSFIRRLFSPLNLLSYSIQCLFSGVKPSSGILESIRLITPRPLLLIACGRGREQRYAQLFYEVAGEPKEIWKIQNARHGGGLFINPDQYAAKITKFFDDALLIENT